MPRLILASSSPRRSELLELLGVPFEVHAPSLDETRFPGEEAMAYVERLARAKAAAVTVRGAVSVGADTVVLHEGHVLGKPIHPAEARSMLRRLSGDEHHVVTAVAAATLEEDGLVAEAAVETALVRFASLTDGEIDAYVDTGEPLDKAGGYAIQGKGSLLVDSIEGHPTTVVGLPLPSTRRLLARFGIQPLG